MPTESIPSEAAERLRLRYPAPRVPRPLLIALVGLLAAAFLGWLIWAATVQSRPEVSGQVSSYRVLSDTQIAVTVTVQRPDPSRAAVCNVAAQAEDFQIVGAQDRLAVPPRTEKIVDLSITLTTLRRATSASVKNCSLT